MYKIEIFPIPEKDWWKDPNNKELTIVPIENWTTESEEYRNKWENISCSWSWWGLVDNPDIHFFINQSSKIIAFESCREDELLEELLNIFIPENSLVFIPTAPENIWKLEEVSDKPIFSNRSQKKLEPVIKLVSDWGGMKNKEIVNKILPMATIKPEKSYKFTYLPTGYTIPFDVWYDIEYSIDIFLGTKKMSSSLSTYSEIIKEGSLLEALILNERKLWKENIKLS